MPTKVHRFPLNRVDLNVLCESINSRRSMLEIGSLAGGSTMIFAEYFDRVYSIDPYIAGYDDNDVNSDTDRLEQAKSIFEKRFKRNKIIKQYNITSKEAHIKFRSKIFDLVYIDACHTYDCVKDDIQLWRNRCRYISGHDWHWSEVKKAITDTFNINDINIFKGNHWMVKLI